MEPQRGPSADHSRASGRILIGLIVGALLGLAFNWWGDNPVRQWILHNVVDPVGQAFLRGLFLIVVPLVFSSLAVGVANLGGEGKLARLGWRVGLFYAGTSLAAILIGQFLVSVLRPGDGVPRAFVDEARAGLAAQVSSLVEKSTLVRESLWPGLVSTIIPRNLVSAMANAEMLAIIFSAIVFGIALLRIDRDRSHTALKILEAVSDCSILIVGWIMKAAPFAVAALVLSAVSKFGFEIMGTVVKYVGVVILGYLLHFFGFYSLVLTFLVRLSPREFYRRGAPAIVTAFGTSSSNATIPTTIRVLETRFGLPKSLTTFSVPLGATVNMDGTALFEMVAAVFVAQVFGIELGLTQQFTLVLLMLLTSVGVAGVPGGSIPILISAMATVGIPPEGIALVLGVDRLLDMGRTVVNVTGDMTAALYLARVEGWSPGLKPA